MSSWRPSERRLLAARTEVCLPRTCGCADEDDSGPKRSVQEERRVFEWEVGYFQGSVASDLPVCAE